MQYDSCSFSQQEGTNCGRYPTCQKRTDMQTPQQNTNTGRRTFILKYSKTHMWGLNLLIFMNFNSLNYVKG